MHITLSCVGWSLMFGAIYQYCYLNGNVRFFHQPRGILIIAFTMIFYAMPSYAVVVTSIDRPATIEYIKTKFPNTFDLFMRAPCHGVILNTHGKIYYAVLCIQILLVSVVGLIVGIKIVKKLAEVKDILSPATLKARRQLFISLSFQAFIPIVFLFGPIIFLYISIGIGWQSINCKWISLIIAVN